MVEVQSASWRHWEDQWDHREDPSQKVVAEEASVKDATLGYPSDLESARAVEGAAEPGCAGSREGSSWDLEAHKEPSAGHTATAVPWDTKGNTCFEEAAPGWVGCRGDGRVGRAGGIAQRPASWTAACGRGAAGTASS